MEWFKDLKRKVRSRFENSSINSGIIMAIMLSAFVVMYLLFSKKQTSSK